MSLSADTPVKLAIALEGLARRARALGLIRVHVAINMAQNEIEQEIAELARLDAVTEARLAKTREDGK